MRRFFITLILGAAIAQSTAFAASIGSESSIGLAADANSNPYLVSSGAQAAESAAFLANVPISYNGDENTVDVIPRVRFAETHGPAELLTDYQYLDADWRFASERNSLTATADWHHDSTLYNVFENGALNGRTVYREENLASLGWQRLLSERSDFQINGSYDRIDYDAAAGATLSSYEYEQGSAQYDHQIGERWQASLIGGYGSFRPIQLNYHGQQEFGDLALTRLLSERWSVKAQVGYSWLQNRLVQPELFCPVSFLYCYFGVVPFETVQVTLHSSGSSPTGQLLIERRYERTTIDLSGSRNVVPSGLGALVVQSDVAISATYQVSARWQLAATLHGASLSDATPQSQSQIGNRHAADLDLSANWQWTEHWQLQLGAIVHGQDINGQYAHGVAFSVGAFRQFGRVRIH